MKDSSSIKTLAAALLVSLCGSASHAIIIRVNDDSPATSGNGSSWGQAMRHLSDALAAAGAGDEVWVASGSYRADTSNTSPAGTNNRDATFMMKSGVRILGGFNGSETAAAQRNPTANVTILNGDIGTPNVRTDNTRSIVTATSVNNTAVLDGFTLRVSYREGGFPSGLGGAINITGGQGPLINNCIFDGNYAFGGAGIRILNTTGTIVTNSRFINCDPATWRGGGIEATTSTGLVITDCSFENNTAYFGGGFYANEYSGGLVARAKFVGNSSVNGGAVSLNGFSDFTFRESRFLRNQARQLGPFQQSFNGGAVNNWCTASRFINCLFVNNSANGQGGAIIDNGPSNSSSTLINCTIYGNHSRDGGAVAATTGHDPILVNSILWANTRTNGTSVSIQGAVNSTFSAVEDPTLGLPTADPVFLDPNGADNILGNDDDDFSLGSASPYRDTGSLPAIPVDVTIDLLGNARVVNGDNIAGALPDFGAIEFVPPPPPFCQGDADRSGSVNFLDITTVLANFGTSYAPSSGPGDADNSGTVNFTDITQVLATFGNVCPSN